MSYRDTPIGQSITFMFSDTPGKVQATFVINTFVGGSISAHTYAIVEVASGLYKFTFTPLVTGAFTIFSGASKVFEGQVVSRDLYQTLQNIEDEALGNWVWDKATNILTLYRQTGVELVSFNVEDTAASNSRTVI